MCRFLLIKSNKPIKPETLLHKFATMSKNSKTFDGDWQGDGWGVTSLSNNEWIVKKSLKPIWEDSSVFSEIPESTMFLVHARSASFPQHKNVIEFNQPYVSGKYAFVFNGLLKGVALPYPVEGKIGAQKIWNLLQEYLKSNSPEKSLEMVKETLVKHSKFIQALNIGLSDGENMYSLCHYNHDSSYYHLQVYNSDTLSFISSESLDGYSSQAVDINKITSVIEEKRSF